MFRVLWRSIRDVFDDMFFLMMTNVIWFVITAPLLLLAGYGLVQGAAGLATVFALLAIIPLGPAMGGLYTVAQRSVEGRTSKLADFFGGMRQYAVLGWKVYGLWMLGLITLLFNLGFYTTMASTVGAVLQILFLYVLLLWLAFLVYIGPLMILQTDKRLVLIARNAALMALGRPLFTLVTLLLMLAIIVLSILPGILLVPALITFALLAVWSFRATVRLIEDAEERRRIAAEKAAAAGTTVVYSTDKGRGGQIKPRK